MNLERNSKCRYWVALFISIVLFVSFSVMQALDTKSASDTDQVQLSVTVAETVSLDCGADVDLGTLTPGTAVSNSTVCTVTTNSGGGYELQAKRDDADTTLDLSTDATVNLTDKTAWDSSSPTSASYSGTGLGFSVFASTATKNATWWGSGSSCHDASNLYAGFPDAYETIMDHDSYESSSTTTSICYRLDSSSTQKSGAYTGTVTYQATTTP